MDILLIDNSNIFIGLDVDNRFPFWPFWSVRFDYLKFAKAQFKNVRAVKKILVGSTPPPKDDFWNVMRNQGFDVPLFERTIFGEKKVDTEIVAQGLEAIYKCKTPGRLVLMSGDADMEPLVRRAHKESWAVELWTWRGSISSEYAQSDYMEVKFIDDVQDDFVFHEPTDADPFRETLGEYKERKERERVEQEKERERQRVLWAEKCEQQRIQREKEFELQQILAQEKLKREQEERLRKLIEIKQKREAFWKKWGLPIGAGGTASLAGIAYLATKILKNIRPRF